MQETTSPLVVAPILSGPDKGRTITARPLTTTELKALSPGQRILVYTAYFGRNRHRGFVHVKINGKPKTWKTRPSDVTVPIKYGLYEYARIDYRDDDALDPNLFLVAVVSR